MEQINNNWEEGLKNTLDNSIIIHKPTLEFLIKKKAINEIYLFIFYCYCSKLQRNHKKIWASNDFVRKNLGIRKQTLLAAKKQLTEWGIIETTPYKEKEENSNKKVIKRWLVNIKPLLNAENIIKEAKSPEVPNSKSPEVPVSRGWKWEPQFNSNKYKFLSNKLLLLSKDNNNSKNAFEDHRDQDVEFVFNLFEEYLGIRPIPIKSKNGFDLNRGAAKRLVKKFGREKVKLMLEKIFEAQMNDPYCRKSSNPLEVEKNLAWYKIYFSQKKGGVIQL